LALECLEDRAVPTVLSAGDIDVSVNYTNNAGWELNLHSDEADRDYEPDSTLLYAGRSDRLTQPNDARYSFTGARPGHHLWVLSQTADLLNPRLNLSVANDGVEPGTFASYTETDPRANATGTFIKLNLIDVRGPGKFSMWTTGSTGDPTVWMSTAQTGVRDNTYWLENHGDSAVNFGFTAKGLYEVDFQAVAYLGDDLSNPTCSGVVTYHFGVEDTGDFSTDPGANPATVGAVLALSAPPGAGAQPVAPPSPAASPGQAPPWAFAIDATWQQTAPAFPLLPASLSGGAGKGGADAVGAGSPLALPFGPADAVFSALSLGKN
jgi:hypothetical protein